MSCI